MPSPSINLIKSSDGTGNAAMATVQSTRAPGASTIIVDTVDNIPATFYGSMGTPHTFVDPITAETITVISEATSRDFEGHVDGTNLEIDAMAPGNTDLGSSAGDVIIIKPTTEWANNVAELLNVAHNDDGTLKAVVANQGWTEITGTTISGNPTYNGNRSYDVTFASSVAAILSPGMRALFDKTVAGNAYMAGPFNGTSQYFTKVSPTGALGTVTDNFTIITVIQPTSYAVGYIASRCDASGNNLLGLQMTATGQIAVAVVNGGAANYRVVTTLASVPLFKKTHIKATWAAGVVTVEFGGVAVSVSAASTGGTAPTTAGTGGDFSLGRQGASSVNYFPGYISSVAIFNTVLSSATAKQYSTYKLTGSETNCIGAWDLDNNATDKSSLGNNLTATGGVGYTAMSPHGQLGNGVSASQAVGLCMAVNGSTATFQLPEGCTLPTTGGITNVSYATSGNPFGWVPDKSRWACTSHYKITSQQTSPAASTFYNPSNRKLNVPAGTWYIGHNGTLSGTAAGGNAPFINAGMGTSPSSIGNLDLLHVYGIGVANIYIKSSFYKISTSSISLASATDYYEVIATETALNTSVELLSCDLFAYPAGV